MRIIRPVLAILLLVTTGLLPRAAYAHASTIKGLVKLMPEAPAPGQSVRLQVDLLDVYNADVPGARIRAAFAPDGNPWTWSATLKEEPVGVYTAEVRTPGPGPAVILLEAALPDGKWYAELYLRVGPGGRPVFQEPVDFIHEDELKKQGTPSQPAPGQPSALPPAPVPRPETAVPAPQTPAQAPSAAAPSPGAAQMPASDTPAPQPQLDPAGPQPAAPRPETGTTQASQVAPPVSAARLNEMLARASPPAPLPWALGGGALGLGLLLWWIRRAQN